MSHKANFLARDLTMKRLPFWLFVAAATSLALAQSVVHAQDRGTFDPFVVDDLSAPKSVKTINNPTGNSPASKVYSFSIPKG
jgi:hypothetical protein